MDSEEPLKADVHYPEIFAKAEESEGDLDDMISMIDGRRDPKEYWMYHKAFQARNFVQGLTLEVASKNIIRWKLQTFLEWEEASNLLE